MSDGPSSAGSSARTRLVYIAAITCSFGVLFGHDTGTISGALLHVTEDFALDPFWLFAAIGIVAWFFVYFMVPWRT